MAVCQSKVEEQGKRKRKRCGEKIFDLRKLFAEDEVGKKKNSTKITPHPLCNHFIECVRSDSQICQRMGQEVFLGARVRVFHVSAAHTGKVSE